jgi:dTDP-glucose 4,6-dehydratase
MQNKKIPIYGDGKYLREWIFVDDFCSALNAILLKGKINNTYNVGSEERLSNIYLTKKIIKISENILNLKINNKLINFVKDRPGHDRSYKIDSKKLRSQTKWKNQISLEYGLTKTVLWYIKNTKWLNYTKKKYDGRRLGLK